jgi:siroheme synthase-like protein
MPNGLPVVLQLEGVPCLVLGTNAEAESKAEMLERSGAAVTRLDSYHPGCLKGYTLAIAALDHRYLNPVIFREAAQLNVLLNCVDDPPHCRFILASVFERGRLQVAVSTGGACPALAVRLREKLEQELGPEYAAFLEIARNLRDEIASRVPDFNRRRALWYDLVDSPALQLLAENKPQQALQEFKLRIDRASQEAAHAPGH